MASNDMNLVFLLLVLLVSSISAKVFLSIDCGSSYTSTDENLIEWSPDDAYITTGKSQVVSSLYLSSFAPLNTLRVFQTGSNNCYSITIDKGEQVLVRASFYYGNYDRKFIPPSFDLQLNGKYWATVVTDLGIIGRYCFYEAIIVVQGGDLSVCLVQTIDGQFPFISVLELRSLDTSMYTRIDPNRALYKKVRAIGSNIKTVRYPDDIYDRIWSPIVQTPTTSNNALLTIDVKVKDKPPVAALQGALTSYLATTSISFQLLNELQINKVPVYIIMYFVELDELGVTDKRSFNVYIDNKRLTSTPITPSYGIASEWIFSNLSASSTTEFSLKATSDSTKPPIINAFELYTFSGDSDTSSNNNNINNNNNDNNNNNNNNFGTGDSNNFNPNNGLKGGKKGKTRIVGGTLSVVGVVLALVGSVLAAVAAVASLVITLHNKRKAAIAAGT